MTDEKDDVHWITGAEIRAIYAEDLSLDKYDEIRKRSVPAYEAMLAESNVRKEMAKTVSEILDREWMCDLKEIQYILDCVANGNTDPFKRRPEKGVDQK
jgi:hypothetical protein